MNISKLTSKRIVLPTIAAVVALGAGGAVWASAANADEGGVERARVASTAPGGVAVDPSGRPGPNQVKGDGGDAEPVLTPDQRMSAEKAALDAVGGGTVTEVEAGDDAGDAAYEVDVRASDNTEWDVELDAGFKVLNKTVDD